MKRKSLDQVIESLQICNRRESIYLYLPVSILVFVGESILTTNAGQSTITLTTAAYQHVSVLMITVCFLLVLQWFTFDLRLTLSLIVLTLFLGPLGALTGLGIGCFYLLYRKLSSPFSALLEQLFPEEQQVHAVAKLALRIERGLENVDIDTTAVPFMDIMTFGSLTQRLRAVSLILRYFHPKLGPVLQLGLRDSNNSVRVLAATSLLALEKNFFDDYLLLEEEVQKSPRSRLNWLALAKHADDYANSKILSPERETKMLKVAHKAFESYANLTTMNDEILVALARIDLRLGDVVKARHTLESLVSRGVRDAAVIKLLEEALFLLSDYSALRAIAKLSSQEGLTGNEIDKEIVTHLTLLWNSPWPQDDHDIQARSYA